MSAVLKYVVQEKKTTFHDRQLVTGINCQPEICYAQFISTKLQHGKCDGKMYFHFVQSFHPDENITPQEAHAAALELAQQWSDHEVVVATHSDTAHIHSHFIVNSVSFKNGKKLHFEKDDLTQLRKASDEICARHGFSICTPTGNQTSGIKQAEYRTAMKGESWKVSLAIQIDECMKYAVNKNQFIELMRSEGYLVKWTDTRANITYTDPDSHRCRDFRLHDKKYLKENMEYEFNIREAEYAAHYGRNESYAADCAEPEHRQSREHSESGHADGGELDRAYRSAGADRSVSSQATRHHGSANYERGSGHDAQSSGEVFDGAVSDGGLQYSNGGSGAEQKLRRTFEEDGGCHRPQSEQDAAVPRNYAEGVRETGWESQREIFFQSLRGNRFHAQICESNPLADVSADNHSGAVGIGAASLVAGLSLIDDDSDDPEAQRRKIEAEIAAKNFGAAIGITAGAIIAANKNKDIDRDWQQTM